MLTCEQFLSSKHVAPGQTLSGQELQRLFWRVKGLERQLEKEKSFWASTNEALAIAFRRLEDRNARIQSILETIQQGIFIIDESLTIQPGTSAWLQNLLGPYFEGRTQMAGLKLADVLGLSRSTEDFKVRALESLQNILGFQALSFDLNSAWLPKELALDGDKHWELDWVPMENSAGIIERIMVCIRDVTELKIFRRRLESHSHELEMIGQMVRLSVSDWRRLERETLATLELARQLAEVSGPAAMPRLLQSLHTLKGNARMYGLSYLSQAVHSAEGACLTAEDDLVTPFIELRTVLSDYRAIRDEKLGGQVASVNTDSALSPALLETFDALIASDASPQTKVFLRAFVTEFFRSFDRLLHDLFVMADKLAVELEMPTPIFRIEGGDKRIHPRHAECLVSILGHLIRNSLHHGFSREKRGELHLALRSRSDGRWALIYFDNGRGLDLELLKIRASQEGRGLEQATAQEIADSIFEVGVSTAQQLSEISGRGLGMRVVRGLAEEMEGRVELRLREEIPGSACRPFEIHFDFPSSVFWTI